MERLSIASDYEKGAKYLKAAADQSDHYRELYYGICLLERNGGRRDARLAVEYIYIFYTFGERRKCYRESESGFCPHEGVGVRQNEFQSVEYFKESADSGNLIAQFNSGLWCFNGESISNDSVEACDYFKFSAVQESCLGRAAFAVCLSDDLVDYDDEGDAGFYGGRGDNPSEREIGDRAWDEIRLWYIGRRDPWDGWRSLPGCELDGNRRQSYLKSWHMCIWDLRD
jgi:hypothetical protein